MSDFHYGPLTSIEHVKSALALAVDLKPDLIALTGDYVQLSTTILRYLFATRVNPKAAGWLDYKRRVRAAAKRLGEAFASVTPKDGIVAAFGNHEHLEGTRTVMKQFPKNTSWLINGSMTIRRSSAILQIAAIDDMNRGKPDLERALGTVGTGVEKASVRVLLSHNPDVVLDKRSELLSEVNLVLCGHTHGGQIRLPFVGPIITKTKQRQHVAGLSFHGETPIYVTHGVGYGGVSLRLLCPPEITLIEFVRG
jgi:predicted MPP superfamily phosphohydrolase